MVLSYKSQHHKLRKDLVYAEEERTCRFLPAIRVP